MLATKRINLPHDAATETWSNSRLGFAAGDYNLFRYVGNRATDESDPSGNASYSDAKGAVFLAEQQLQKVRRLIQSDESLKEIISAETEKYQQLNTQANELVGEYERNVWYPWPWATHLQDEASALPATIGHESVDPGYLASLQSAVSAQQDALQRLCENSDFAYSAASGLDKTLAVGIVIIAVVGAVAVVAPVTFTILATGVIGINLGRAAHARWRNGDGGGFGAIPGAVADVSGLSALYAGATDRDIISQDHLGLSGAQRGEALGSGTASMLLWVVGGKVSKGGQKFATKYLKPSVFGRIEPNLPALGNVNRWFNQNADRDLMVQALSPGQRKLYDFGLKTVDQWKQVQRYTYSGETELTGKEFIEGAIARGKAFAANNPKPTNIHWIANYRNTVPFGPTTAARVGISTATSTAPSIVLTLKLSDGKWRGVSR